MNYFFASTQLRLKKVFKSIAIVFAFPIFFSSCNVLQVVHLLKAGKVEQKKYYQEIPLNDQERLIVLEVIIDGVTYHFALDTGAPTMISEDLAKKTSIKAKCEVSSSDSQGNKSTAAFSKVKEMQFGQISYRNQGVAIYDFNQMRELSCFKFDGILGANTMRQSVWQFDIKNNVLRIASSIDSFSIPESIVPIRFKQQLSGTPVFTAEIDGISIPGISLDYGSDYCIELGSERLCDSILKKNKPDSRIFGYGSLGLYGGKHDTLYTFKFPEIKIDGQSFPDPAVRINKSGESTIGTDFLKNYLVTVDWDKKYVYMEKIDNKPPSDFSVPFGFNVIWQDAKLIVVTLVEDSPAFNAGLQLGDQLLMVNGTDYTKVRPDQYCDIFMNGLINADVKEIELVYKSDTLTKQVTLHLN